jgi:hypothetical protein
LKKARQRGLALVISVGLALGCDGEHGDSPAAPGSGARPETSIDITRPLALAPGEVVELAVVDGRAAARLQTSAGSEKFVAIIASTRTDPASGNFFSYGLTRDPVSQPTGARLARGCALTSEKWRNTPVPTEKEPAGTAITVGSERTLKILVGNRLETISARAAAVSNKAVVWADTTPAHPATLDASFIDEFIGDFDRTILPRERQVFGMESDIDGDGRIGLVFSPLTRNSAVAFFVGCDLLESKDCSTANQGEYLYLTPPANIAPPYNTPAAMKEILAHELGHLVHFGRKVLRNKLDTWAEGVYLGEGLGGFAQDVIGFQAGNLYVTQAGLEQIADFSVGDILGGGLQTIDARDGALRGGGYLFVRFLYDRAGGDSAKPDGSIEGKGGSALMRALLDSPRTVAATLPSSLEGSIADLVADFYTALALSNQDKVGHAVPANDCFSFLPAQQDPLTGRQRGADLFTTFHGQTLGGPKMSPAADGELRSGGVEYITMAATPGQSELDLTVSVDATAEPRVRIARLK